MGVTLCNNAADEADTDIFDSIRNTENKILKMMQDNNIAYENPIDLNKGIPYRFSRSDELLIWSRTFIHIHIRFIMAV